MDSVLLLILELATILTSLAFCLYFFLASQNLVQLLLGYFCNTPD